ncbi:hypothetical protein [Desulfoscipio gibsoniae]|uniref:1,4-beta-N-acetylmuramidase n=1 Tax=Desulfoscipio gibsoniae DSM 7213 TaxID=767817 RepID=R4KL22_9FIRM|nr:hypothetical protein [Desulfoscipio gibsoniae]AGL00336.1 hypothetical protein Desgi_0784 [Desulfoscipio gibsoniae DSM 7213]
MRKTVVLVVALLLSLTMASAAFAHSSGYVTYFNNGGSGWVSNGQHGHYWSGFDGPVIVKGISNDGHFNAHDWGYGYSRGGSLYRYNDANGKAHYYYDWDNDGDWYYYKDDNGRNQYVYIDPDREGEWYRYYDKNGNIQYYYDVR